MVLDDDNPAGVVTIGAGSSTQSVTEGLPVTAIVTATTTGDQEPHKDFTASVVADELATPQATVGVDFTADTFAITFPGNTGLHGTNWKRAEVGVWVQTMQVTVVTAHDTIDEPHEAFRVYLEAISAPFTKGTPDTVTITLKDAAPGVTVDPVELTIAEGAIKTYIVVLNTKPTGDVTVAITGPRRYGPNPVGRYAGQRCVDLHGRQLERCANGNGNRRDRRRYPNGRRGNPDPHRQRRGLRLGYRQDRDRDCNRERHCRHDHRPRLADNDRGRGQELHREAGL